MGNIDNNEEKREASILRHPKQGEASKLYWACRRGDLDAVKKIVASTSFTDIYCLEPNWSTALHATTYFGHADIVRLLLQEIGVVQHKRCRHGHTAFEESPNEQIRCLYYRPADNQRFCSSTETKFMRPVLIVKKTK